MMKRYLEQTELFSCMDVERTVFTWQGDDLIPQWPVPLKRPTQALKEPKADPNLTPFAPIRCGHYQLWLACCTPWPDAQVLAGVMRGTGRRFGCCPRGEPIPLLNGLPTTR